MKIIYLLLLAMAGFVNGFQPPINTLLSKKVGILEASFISFLGGTLVLGLLVLFFGKGNLLAFTTVPKWQLIGGLLGVVIVISAVIGVPRVGVSTALIAMIFGQMLAATLVDHFGLFEVPLHPFTYLRLSGFILVFLGIILIFKK